MNRITKILSIDEAIGEIVSEVSTDILNYTPQLFYLDYLKNTSYNKPEPLASGVLINVCDNVFLITAGHVIEDNNPENIGIMIQRKFHHLNGEVRFVEPSKSDQNDKIDLAVWKIDDDVAFELNKRYCFLDINKVEYTHQPSSDKRYLIVGFPTKRTKLNIKSQNIKPNPFILLTKEVERNFYNRLNIQNHSNIILEYRIAKIKSFATGSYGKGPFPEGLSGCGLWHLPNLLVEKGKKASFKLVGIMIGYRKEFNIVVSTRIHFVTELLRQIFKLDLQVSKISKVTIHT